MIKCKCGAATVICKICIGIGYIAEAHTEDTKCCSCHGTGFFCKNCHRKKKAPALLLKKEGVFIT